MDVQQALKKAQRKQRMKMIGIALATVFIVLPILYKGANMISGHQANKVKDAISTIHTISEPNVSIDAHHLHDTATNGGTVVTKRYKDIDGYVVPWGMMNSSYSWRGYRIDRDTLSPGWHPGKTDYQYDKNTKQKVAVFYHPDTEKVEGGIPNDLAAVATMDGFVAEMALSFDQAYSLKEVLRQLPDTLNVTWAFVDSEAPKEAIGPIYPVYGFTIEEDIEGSIDVFQEALQVVKGSGEDEVIERMLKAKDPSFVRGVIVTGQAQNMKALETLDIIRGASVGVTVETKPYIEPTK